LNRLSQLDPKKLKEPNYIKNAIVDLNRQELQKKLTQLKESDTSHESSYNPFRVSNIVSDLEKSGYFKKRRGN
jgi:hypothetical protein